MIFVTILLIWLILNFLNIMLFRVKFFRPALFKNIDCTFGGYKIGSPWRFKEVFKKIWHTGFLFPFKVILI